MRAVRPASRAASRRASSSPPSSEQAIGSVSVISSSGSVAPLVLNLNQGSGQGGIGAGGRAQDRRVGGAGRRQHLGDPLLRTRGTAATAGPGGRPAPLLIRDGPAPRH